MVQNGDDDDDDDDDDLDDDTVATGVETEEKDESSDNRAFWCSRAFPRPAPAFGLSNGALGGGGLESTYTMSCILKGMLPKSALQCPLQGLSWAMANKVVGSHPCMSTNVYLGPWPHHSHVVPIVAHLPSERLSLSHVLSGNNPLCLPPELALGLIPVPEPVFQKR